MSSIENSEGKIVAENNIAVDKKISNTQIISIPRPIKNEIDFNESNNDEEDEQISVNVAIRNYDKKPITGRDLILFTSMAFAAFSLFNAFEYFPIVTQEISIIRCDSTDTAPAVFIIVKMLTKYYKL